MCSALRKLQKGPFVGCCWQWQALSLALGKYSRCAIVHKGAIVRAIAKARSHTGEVAAGAKYGRNKREREEASLQANKAAINADNVFLHCRMAII